MKGIKKIFDLNIFLFCIALVLALIVIGTKSETVSLGYEIAQLKSKEKTLKSKQAELKATLAELERKYKDKYIFQNSKLKQPSPERVLRTHEDHSSD